MTLDPTSPMSLWAWILAIVLGAFVVGTLTGLASRPIIGRPAAILLGVLAGAAMFSAGLAVGDVLGFY